MAKAKPQNFLIGGLMYVLLFAAGNEEIGGGDSDNKCGGEERWEQKILVDLAADSIKARPKVTTIALLHTIDTKLPENKYKEGRSRMEIEKQVYTIKNCFITEVLRENDNDLHLVIEDGKGHTMIAEMPDIKCNAAKNSEFSGDFREARETLLQYAESFRHYQFTITGVLFVDKSHGQTGRAPNNVELHPVLKLKKERKIKPILQ